jgi:prepilin-type N-terminal cleavage/methylation domain-containing protein
MDSPSLLARDRPRQLGGFTLIELLIVVAIIAILAAIAVPNFLEAQVRAKTSRARSDLRSITTALEAYHVDHNRYPTMIELGFAGGVAPLAGSDLKWWYVPDRLSTPVSYLSSAALLCPFGGNVERRNDFPDELWRRYSYENIGELVDAAATFSILQGRYVTESAYELAGDWRMNSVGPDALWNPSVMFDPTNGTTSAGDIVRTQRDTAGNSGVSPRG